MGRYLVETRPKSVEIIGTSRRELVAPLWTGMEMRTLDLSRQDPAVLLEEIRPDVVIHAAAEGSVDAVENRAADFWALNVEVPRRIADWCQRREVRLVHVSSNAVFGRKPGPYDDFSEHSPINDYGRLKSAAERAVLQVNDRALLIRPITMYGWTWFGSRKNPAEFWIEEMRRGREVRVVHDVWTQPLAAADAGRAIWLGLEQESRGPVNVSGGVTMTLYRFACMVAAAFDLSQDLVIPIESVDLHLPAVRPQHVEFTNSRIENELGLIPAPPLAGLAKMLREEGGSQSVVI